MSTTKTKSGKSDITRQLEEILASEPQVPIGERQTQNKSDERTRSRTKKTKGRRKKVTYSPESYSKALQRLLETQREFRTYLAEIKRNPQNEQPYVLQERLLAYAKVLGDYRNQLAVFVTSLNDRLPTIRKRRNQYLEERQRAFEEFSRLRKELEETEQELESYKEKIERKELHINEIGITHQRIADLETRTIALGYNIRRISRDAHAKDNLARLLWAYEVALTAMVDSGTTMYDQINQFIETCAGLVELALPLNQASELIRKTATSMGELVGGMNQLFSYFGNMANLLGSPPNIQPDNYLNTIETLTDKITKYRKELSHRAEESSKEMKAFISRS